VLEIKSYNTGMGSSDLLLILRFVKIFQLFLEFDWKNRCTHAHTHAHTHTHTHTQHGDNISIVLFLFREESWLNTAVLLVASNRCEAVTLKEEKRMGIFEKRQPKRIFGLIREAVI